MLSSYSIGQFGTPDAAEINSDDQLSHRSALACIIALSLLSWAAVVLPLWRIVL